MIIHAFKDTTGECSYTAAPRLRWYYQMAPTSPFTLHIPSNAFIFTSHTKLASYTQRYGRKERTKSAKPSSRITSATSLSSSSFGSAYRPALSRKLAAMSAAGAGPADELAMLGSTSTFRGAETVVDGAATGATGTEAGAGTVAGAEA